MKSVVNNMNENERIMNSEGDSKVPIYYQVACHCLLASSAL